MIEANIDGHIVQFDAEYWDYSANGVCLIKDKMIVATIHNDSWSYLRKITPYDKLSANSNDETTFIPRIDEE